MRFTVRHFAASILAATIAVASAQTARPAPGAVPVLMLSDLHFDPFRDPAKVPKLAAAPVAEWAKILATPETPDRAASYAALEAACKAKGEDSDYSLIDASLKAEKAVVPDPKFVAISGDLLVHQFDCRYRGDDEDPGRLRCVRGKDGVVRHSERRSDFSKIAGLRRRGQQRFRLRRLQDGP